MKSQENPNAVTENLVLETKDLHFSYGMKEAWTFEDITMAKKDRLLILGPSGCGKTTLLHLLCGLLTPSKGHVMIAGKNLSSASKNKVDKIRGQEIGIVFQRPHFIQSLSVLDNILLPFKFHESPTEEVPDKMIDQLHIGHLLHKKTNELSEGEKQRVGIARALVHQPALVLADEPTSALDDENCRTVIDLLVDMTQERDSALVVVTHDSRIKDFFSHQLQLQAS